MLTFINGLFQLRDWISDQFAPEQAKVDWKALAKTFFKLGFIGFGGGIAVISQIRRLVVRERRWLSEEEFLDAVSLAQSLPGANAANA
ncbi:MAG TPA: chromate transporter, partial [Blastocatellia bacterium]|nr:chromate transporter [Blastocatellia bacterium]